MTYFDQSTAESTLSGPRAGFWQRVGAALIDGILLGLVAGILFAVLKDAGYLVAIVLQGGYYTFFEGGPKGQTPGKQALNLRVVSIDTGESIGHNRAFIRWLSSLLSALALYLGYLWMLWDPQGQTWHDKFARSVVVMVV